MNKYKLAALGFVIALCIAYVADALMENAAVKMIAFALIVWLFTLDTTRRFAYRVLEVSCIIVAALGHVTGKYADKLADVAYERRQRLVRPPRQTVPAWEDLHVAGEPADGQLQAMLK